MSLPAEKKRKRTALSPGEPPTGSAKVLSNVPGLSQPGLQPNSSSRLSQSNKPFHNFIPRGTVQSFGDCHGHCLRRPKLRFPLVILQMSTSLPSRRNDPGKFARFWTPCQQKRQINGFFSNSLVTCDVGP
jgi:hypothetical protein